MKKINYFLIVFGLLLLSTSCEDFLKEEVIDEVSVDYIYSTPEGLEVGVNALYNLQRHYNFPERTSHDLRGAIFFMVGSDLGLSRTWWMPYHGDRMMPLRFPSGRWTLPYQTIDRANGLISNARNIDMDQIKKNKLIAQVRAIRGELYLDLIRSYDNILLDTIATTNENAFEPVEYKPANPTEVFKLIDADLDFAIQHLDWEVDYGRYGQGAVRHIRGKSAMWQGKWAEAVEQFDAIVENGTYYLLPNTKDVFGQNLNHAEALFVYPRDEGIGGNDMLAGGGGTYFAGFFNNRQYEIPSGEVIKTVENGGLTMGWAFPNDYLKSLYDQENDRRFETYYYPLKLYVNNPEKPNFGEPLPESSYPDNFRQYHWSLKKYHDENKAPPISKSYKDMMKYRFAETLLLGAEAHWRLSGEDSYDAKALEYINLVRARAGVPPFESFDRDTYLEESARELAFEGNRWFLLKRMGLLVERQNLHYRFGSNSINVTPLPMDPHMVRLPIPQSQIDLMMTFPQNPGY